MSDDTHFSRLGQFACPQADFDPLLYEAVLALHAQAVAEQFGLRHEAAIARCSEGVAPLIAHWCRCASACARDARIAWDMAFGRLQWALESDGVDAGDAALHLALHLSVQGVAGDWQGRLSTAGAMRWGRWLLPVARQIAVESDGSLARVSYDDAVHRLPRTLVFQAGPGGWGGDVAAAIDVVGIHQPIQLLPHWAIRDQLTLEDSFGSIVGYPEPGPAMAQTLRSALQLLESYAPEYLTWVERVIRAVVICRCKETRTRSSTWSEAPGIILLSETTDAVTVAEMLVHEASHQYFHIVGRMGKVDDGSDPRRYYSPAVARERPLSRVLIAYHAFANILLMYRAFIRNGLVCDDRGWLATAERMEADVGQLAAPLAGNPALTDFGRALFAPLSRLLETGVSVDG